MEEPFHGAKIAVLAGGRVLTLRRDDRPGLVWAGHWDLPGGGREGGESPEACALRELREELALVLDPGRIVWRRVYEGTPPGGWRTWFLVAELEAAPAGLRLGDEGQGWQWMEIRRYLSHDRAVPHHRARLGAYLREVRSMDEEDERVLCRTPTPGREGGTRIPRWKFDMVRKAILHAVAGAGPEGLPFSQLPGAVKARLSADGLARLGSLGWHVTTVKLELEVRGEIERVPGATPQRLVAGQAD